MSRAVLAACLALAGLVLAGGAVRADEMTFFMKNGVGRAVVVELFSQNREMSWPGDDQVYLLETGEKKSVRITCEAGESICYGAWLRGNDGVAFGVGPDNDQACADCCSICVEKTTATVDLLR